MEVDEVLSVTSCRPRIVDYHEFLRESKTAFDRRYGTPSRSRFTIADFSIVRTIGVGSFSTVVVARHKAAGTFHAIKVMSKENIMGLSASRYVIRERHLLRALACPFIVSAQTTFQDNTYLYIVMPFVNGGDLFNQLKAHTRFTEKVAKFFAAQIILALEFMHFMGLVYRDLKPENVLLDSVGYVKLTDFGFCKPLQGRTYTFCGTPEYMAPEIVLGKGYGRAVDWWALGVLTYEMVAGHVPFQAAEVVQLYERIAKGEELQVPAEFSPALANFAQRLLEGDVSRRLGCLKAGIQEVKLHPWLTGVDWKALLDRAAEPPMVPDVHGPTDTSNYDVYDDLQLTVAKEDKFSRQFADF